MVAQSQKAFEQTMQSRVQMASQTSDTQVQMENRRWWNANPMSYDWHKTIATTEGILEFDIEIDRRFFYSSSFYRGPTCSNRPFARPLFAVAYKGAPDA